MQKSRQSQRFHLQNVLTPLQRMPVPAFSLLTGADSATASDSAETEVSSASLADSSFATDFSCSVSTTGSSSGFVLDSSWLSEEEPVKSGAMLDSKEGMKEAARGLRWVDVGDSAATALGSTSVD